MAPANRDHGQHFDDLPRHRTTGQQLSERSGSGQLQLVRKPAIMIKSPKTARVGKESENVINDSLHRVMALIKKYGIREVLNPCLQSTLRKLDGPALLKLALLENEIFEKCDNLFRRVCKKEAGITSKKEDHFWHRRYAKYYFKHRPESRYKEWETELLDKEAYHIVHEKIRVRNETTPKILCTEIPELIIPPNRKLTMKRQRKIANDRGVQIVRAYTKNRGKVEKAPDKKSEVIEEVAVAQPEAPEAPVRELTGPQKWFIRTQQSKPTGDAPLWKKCCKEREIDRGR